LSSLNNDTDKSTPKKGQAAESTPKRTEKRAVSTPRNDSRSRAPGSGAGRRRRGAEAEAEDANGGGSVADTPGLYSQNMFRPMSDSGSVAGSRGSRGSTRGSQRDTGDDDDDDVVDRSARKRQKPLRYRDEKE
jgi:hypothetical protein